MEEQKANYIKKEIYEKLLPDAKQQILQIYHNLYENRVSLTQEEYSAIETLSHNLYNYAKIFLLPLSMQERCNKSILKCIERKDCGQFEQLTFLTELFELMEELEHIIGGKLNKCNICNNDVFFAPFPDTYEEMWKKTGFMYWNADFLLQSSENFSCPVCNATDRERLMAAFLARIQGEEGETVRMLQIAPSCSLNAYVHSRSDIQCETMDIAAQSVISCADLQCMEAVEDEAYELIICSHVLQRAEDDIRIMKELFRILKSQGMCLVTVPLIEGKADTDEQWGCSEEENWRRFSQYDHCRLYGKRDFINRLQKAGFYVNELGKEWFGEEFYREHGFDERSILYVVTKEIRLVPENKTQDIDSAVTELRQENQLLHQALINAYNYWAEQKEEMQRTISLLSHRLDNIGYEISDPKFQSRMWYPKIMNKEETITEIVKHKKSIARFGDGEFSIIAGTSRWKFQKNDERLAHRLKEVLQSNKENVLIGLGEFYGDLSLRPTNAANAVRIYMTPEIRKAHYELLNPDTIYAKADISRSETWEDVELQRTIWEGRDCVFIEGYQTRMGVGNDLFDNAKSIVRILCPAESAFDKYEEIYEEAMKQPKDKLMLIALGPTAGVLAYDLAMQGYQAIDIGHADLCYEWIRRGLFYGEKTWIPHKYNNELVGDFVVEDIHDVWYESQIIADFH
ncbi:MAG: GT-D fold domain-containing protein [Lachnospiraceae bacterium]|nr:GT-D fold domain-containing protein [Lachnospiraceae bacterium]